MTPQGEWPTWKWLRPPGTLFLILFLLTLVSISALGWFGWRLFEQERLVEAQRSRERLEQAADRIAATIRGTLAETGDRLGEWDAPGPGLILHFENDSLSANSSLLFYPYPSSGPEAPFSTFADAEQLEFARREPEKALASYKQLTASPDPSIQAGAWMRTARVLRSLNQPVQAQSAYQKLAEIKTANVAGTPAELVARHALCELGASCAPLEQGLREGRWPITSGQFEFYWAEAARLTGQPGSPPAQALVYSEAASRVWEERSRNPNARGQETIWLADHPYFLLWRGPPDRRAVLVAKPESMVQQVAAAEGIRYALADSEGRVLAGEKSPEAHGAVRTTAESQLPWTLYVTAPQSATALDLIGQQRFLILSIAVMAIFLVLGTYFIARAIRKESETVRMQSDFVSAVSHEFRTPLTSVRQLSELLAHNRVPSEDRRQLYYETLLRESSRLERLVEGLLNFGRMDAGVRQYRFQELDTANLVHRVVAEFEPQLEAQGRAIELAGASDPLTIDADPEAIGVALRNLVDNAIKYSPGQPKVWVDWESDREFVAIRVRDQGPGIPNAERRRIFRRFVRGSAAQATNAKGSGVGLAMVRHIVAAHGGEITVKSAPGQGSVFTMLLPKAGAA